MFLAGVMRARCFPAPAAPLRGAEAAPSALEGAGRGRRTRPASSAPASLLMLHPPFLHPSSLHLPLLHRWPLHSAPFILLPCIPRSCIRSPPHPPPPLRLLRRLRPAAAQRRRAPAGLHGGARGLRRRRGRHGGGFRRLREPAVRRGQALLPAGAGDVPGDPGGPHALQGWSLLPVLRARLRPGSGPSRGASGGMAPGITRETPGWALGAAARPRGCSRRAPGSRGPAADGPPLRPGDVPWQRPPIRQDSPTPLFLPSPVNTHTQAISICVPLCYDFSTDVASEVDVF